jgi:hypothetical protein
MVVLKLQITMNSEVKYQTTTTKKSIKQSSN